MTILHDESGQILILTPPYGVKTKPASAEVLSSGIAEANSPRHPQGFSAARTSHCSFCCRWCGAQILLPHQSLGFPFANPVIRRIEARSIAAVCGSCNKVSNYSLFRGCPGYDTRYKLTEAQAEGKTFLADWLRCDEASCSFSLPLFLTSGDEVSGEKAQEIGGNWNWEELTCQSGHSVHPPRWPLEAEPFQLPPDLRRK
jgi:hypothetical protein